MESAEETNRLKIKRTEEIKKPEKVKVRALTLSGVKIEREIRDRGANVVAV